MTRDEALTHFEIHQVRVVSRAKRLALEADYQKNREALAAEFIASFGRICGRVRKMQDQGLKGPIGYIHYAMLRTAILDRSYGWRIDAYDGSWYRDRRECSGVYDAGWAFKYLAAFEAELNEKRQPYLQQIGRFDVERLMLREAGKYQGYVIALARRAMKTAATLPEYRDIKRGSTVEVRVGEYFDHSEIVHLEEGRARDSKATQRWFEEKLAAEYAYGAYGDLNLADGDYPGVDLRHADLRGSILSRCNLRGAVLTGASLGGGMFNGADLSRAEIYEADFQGSDLRQAKLGGVRGSCGLSEAETNWQPGFSGVNFRNAHLEQADLAGAALAGADFRDANLDGVNFDGADLQGAVFSRDDQNRVERLLDEDQRRAVIWE